jgi:small multidrug resistance pump
MSSRGLTLVVISALCTVAANLMMRGGVLRAGGLTLSDTFVRQLIALAMEPLFVGGFLLYGTAAIVWFQVLSVENLSASYPLLVSLTFVLVTVGAMVFFKENISGTKLLGIGLCLAGVLVVARA